MALLAACSKPADIPAGETLAIPVESSAFVDLDGVTTALGGAPKLAPGLTFLGGMELSSPEPLFGAFSSIRFRDKERFLGVFDTGYFIEGRITRDGTGRLAGLSDVRLAPLLDADGRISPSKYLVDAESLALDGDRAYVGFEQRHRVVAYSPVSDLGQARPSAPLPLPFDVTRLRSNGGIEALVLSPTASPLAGALLALSEKSVDENGNNYAGILSGPLQGEFRVKPHDGFEITDGAFLPDGDLLLLERRFSIATGVGMRLRRIAGATIRPGAVVDGEIIFEADNRSQIDNMEGMDAIVAEDGSIHLIVVSDDNHSILQRTLMLEFRLAN
ncbi:esterase-like activity of phytase family protein [Rhizobium wuzhouense]|uniref:Phytase-like domain-containing protein n=1 Tax=Rhizobium wuzhouense TaxID=1986026 RepID=A0ABX5NRL7_9HYPH|nr:esterase-like activity of phytase family protein [Rhizobium wuzhouense]PYB73971.1 hypothetical protein DMY87_09625 [Rhizobium wuzhouense]